MLDAKLCIVYFRLDVKGIGLVCVVELLQETLVSALGETTLLVEQVKDTKFLKIGINTDQITPQKTS